jgi:hypothetical protein
MIHRAFKKVEIAERYIKAIGKFKTREQAKRTFQSIERANKINEDILMIVYLDIYIEITRKDRANREKNGINMYMPNKIWE